MMRKDDRRPLAFVSGAVFIIIFVIVYYHDPYRFYLLNSDPDLIYAYEALLVNDGQRQDLHDHTAYLYIVLLSMWIELWEFFGIIPVSKLSDVPPIGHAEPAIAAIVFSGRWLSAVLAGVLAVVIYLIARAASVGRLIAGAGAVLAVLSAGVIYGALIMRPELPAMIFALLSLLCLMTPPNVTTFQNFIRPCLAACFAWAAMMTKLQVVPILLALPILAIVFMEKRDELGMPAWTAGRRLLAGLAIVGALAFSFPAAIMIIGQIYISGMSGLYQTVIAIYVVFAASIYGLLATGSCWRTVFGLLSILVGLAIAQYANLITDDVKNTFAMVNFIEHMSAFVDMKDLRTADKVIFESFVRIGSNISAILGAEFTDTRRFIVFPYQPLFWLVSVSLAVLILTQRLRPAFRVGAFFALALAMEAFCAVRGFSTKCFIFVEPWLLLAGVLAATEFFGDNPPWLAEKPRFAAGVRVAIVVIAVLLAVNAGRAAIAEKTWQPPVTACEQARGYLKQLPAYFEKYCLLGNKPEIRK